MNAWKQLAADVAALVICLALMALAALGSAAVLALLGAGVPG